MSLGDSKTVAPWVAILTASLAVGTTLPWRSENGAVWGSSVATFLPVADARLAEQPADLSGWDYKDVLLNWGVNDGVGMGEATWTANYLAIIDKVHAKAPNARVFLMRPWKRGADATAATQHTWIDNIVAARAFTYVGPDEAVWLKGADDGATMTSDGVHYSTAGNAECAAQWQTVLGY